MMMVIIRAAPDFLRCIPQFAIVDTPPSPLLGHHHNFHCHHLCCVQTNDHFHHDCPHYQKYDPCADRTNDIQFVIIIRDATQKKYGIFWEIFPKGGGHLFPKEYVRMVTKK